MVHLHCSIWASCGLLQSKEETKVMCNFDTVIHDFTIIINYFYTLEASVKANNYFSIVFFAFYNDWRSLPSVVDNHSSISHIITSVRHGITNQACNQPLCPIHIVVVWVTIGYDFIIRSHLWSFLVIPSHLWSINKNKRSENFAMFEILAMIFFS